MTVTWRSTLDLHTECTLVLETCLDHDGGPTVHIIMRRGNHTMSGFLSFNDADWLALEMITFKEQANKFMKENA